MMTRREFVAGAAALAVGSVPLEIPPSPEPSPPPPPTPDFHIWDQGAIRLHLWSLTWEIRTQEPDLRYTDLLLDKDQYVDLLLHATDDRDGTWSYGLYPLMDPAYDEQALNVLRWKAWDELLQHLQTLWHFGDVPTLKDYPAAELAQARKALHWLLGLVQRSLPPLPQWPVKPFEPLEFFEATTAGAVILDNPKVLHAEF